jgi:hypothetical protein
MASKKGSLNPPPPSIYRDDPDHAETASMASAVLLDEIETFPDEDLPAYEDRLSEGSNLLPSAFVATQTPSRTNRSRSTDEEDNYIGSM